jgi:hypothetical protein
MLPNSQQAMLALLTLVTLVPGCVEPIAAVFSIFIALLLQICGRCSSEVVCEIGFFLVLGSAICLHDYARPRKVPSHMQRKASKKPGLCTIPEHDRFDPDSHQAGKSLQHYLRRSSWAVDLNNRLRCGRGRRRVPVRH